MKEIINHLKIRKDKVFLKLSLLFFVVWLLFKGPIRNATTTESLVLNTFLGFAPNFFAGITLVFWQIYITNSKPLLTLFCVNAVLFFAEFIQLFVETQTADVLDLSASLVGSVLAVCCAMIVERRKEKA